MTQYFLGLVNKTNKSKKKFKVTVINVLISVFKTIKYKKFTVKNKNTAIFPDLFLFGVFNTA